MLYRDTVIVCAVLLILSSLVCITLPDNENEKTGIIRGMIFKSQEAEVILGGAGKPFDFTLNDPTLLVIAYQALKNNKEVKIMYHHKYFGDAETTFIDSMTTTTSN